MYNTKYKCVQSFVGYDKSQSPVRIERDSIWKIDWSKGKNLFKELRGNRIEVALPDENVNRYFKKV